MTVVYTFQLTEIFDISYRILVFVLQCSRNWGCLRRRV